MKNIGFIGMGNMAEAIAAALIEAKKISPKNLFAFAPNQKRLKENAAKIGFTPCASNTELVQKCDTVFVACKPHQIESVLAEIGGRLGGKNLVSIAASWTHDTYEKTLGQGKAHIQCVMPNTPVRIGQGVVLFEEKNTLAKNEFTALKKLFDALGSIEILPTSQMKIGMAISGCAPAFMDMIMEAYADAAVKYGLGRQQAYRLIAQTMAGSALLQLKTGTPPAALKDAVCSPGGTTIRGVAAAEQAGLRAACIASIDAIMQP